MDGQPGADGHDGDDRAHPAHRRHRLRRRTADPSNRGHRPASADPGPRPRAAQTLEPARIVRPTGRAGDGGDARRPSRSRVSGASHGRRRHRLLLGPFAGHREWRLLRTRAIDGAELRSGGPGSGRPAHHLSRRAGEFGRPAVEPPRQPAGRRPGALRERSGGHRVPRFGDPRKRLGVVRDDPWPGRPPARDDHPALGGDAGAAYRHRRRRRLSAGRAACPGRAALHGVRDRRDGPGLLRRHDAGIRPFARSWPHGAAGPAAEPEAVGRVAGPRHSAVLPHRPSPAGRGTQRDRRHQRRRRAGFPGDSADGRGGCDRPGPDQRRSGLCRHSMERRPLGFPGIARSRPRGRRPLCR